MTRFIILGPSGMLGQAVLAEAKRQQLPYITVGTRADFHFRYEGQSLDGLAKALDLCQTDTIVNCVGWIPQKSSGVAAIDEQQAYRLNRDLVGGLSRIQEAFGFQWVQILTDCVFSGRQGPYFEDSPRDAQDLYGRSKIAGEQLMKGAIGIRSSIVGPDRNSKSGLFAWLKGQLDVESKVDGYSNVFWNGVSTLAFSKLSLALFKKRDFPPGVSHWVPADFVSKFELLRLFADTLHAPEHFQVLNVNHPSSSDRRLATLSPGNSRFLWQLAGYAAVPTIAELTYEFISQIDDRK